jgi:hypothetical protein
MTAVLLYCIIVYFVSGVDLPLCFEQKEILIFAIFCPFLLCPIALLARIAVYGFFRTELIPERFSLDICKDWWGSTNHKASAPKHTHTHTNTGPTSEQLTAILTYSLYFRLHRQTAHSGCVDLRCGAALCAVSPLNMWLL